MVAIALPSTNEGIKAAIKAAGGCTGYVGCIRHGVMTTLCILANGDIIVRQKGGEKDCTLSAVYITPTAA